MSQAELVTQTFNGLAEWAIEGQYFKLMDAAGNVRVELFKRGRTVLVAPSVTAGFYQFVDYDVVKITTGASILVTFLAAPAEGGSDAAQGTVDMTDDAARLVGITYGSLGQVAQQAIGGVNALPVTERGFEYGVSYASNTSIGAAGTSQVFAAASNANGAIVWSARMDSVSASTEQISLLAKVSAPTGLTDGDALMSAMQTAGVMASDKLLRPVFVAAGKGLWFFSGPAETSALRHVLYTLL